MRTTARPLSPEPGLHNDAPAAASIPQLPPSCMIDVDAVLREVAGGLSQDKEPSSAMSPAALGPPDADDAMVRLICRLSQYSTFVLQEVDRSGHCQFDALAHQLACRFRADYPGEARATYATVRADLAGWLGASADLRLDNGARLASFLEARDGADWPAFCSAVAGGGGGRLWGNHLTLVAAANCYRRSVRVWTALDGPQWWFEVRPQPDNTVFDVPFELAHVPERHYMSVTEPQFARTEAVAPVSDGGVSSERWQGTAGFESLRMDGRAGDSDPDPLQTRVWDPREGDGPPGEEDLARGEFCMRNCVCCTVLPRGVYARLAGYFTLFSRQHVLYDMLRESREEDRERPAGSPDYGSWWDLAFHDWCWVPGTRGHPCYCVADLVFCTGAAPCAGSGTRHATKIRRDILRTRQSQYLLSVVIGPALSVLEVSMSGAAVGRCERLVVYIYLLFALALWVATWLVGWRVGGRTRWSAGCLAAWAALRLGAGRDYPGGLLWRARLTYAWIEPDRGLLSAAVPRNATAETRPLFEQAAMREALAACQGQ